MKTSGYNLTFPLGHRVLRVNPSANAWWNDPSKMTLLLFAFRNCGTIDEACTHADITLKQYKYFIEKHPEFTELRLAYKSVVNMSAKKTIIDNMGNLKNAQWWLEKKEPSEFGPPSRRRRKMEEALQLQRETKNPYSPETQAKIDKLTDEYEKSFKKLIIEDRLEKSPKKAVIQQATKQTTPVKSAPTVDTKLSPEDDAREKFKYGIL